MHHSKFVFSHGSATDLLGPPTIPNSQSAGAEDTASSFLTPRKLRHLSLPFDPSDQPNLFGHVTATLMTLYLRNLFLLLEELVYTENTATAVKHIRKKPPLKIEQHR